MSQRDVGHCHKMAPKVAIPSDDVVAQCFCVFTPKTGSEKGGRAEGDEFRARYLWSSHGLSSGAWQDQGSHSCAASMEIFETPRVLGTQRLQMDIMHKLQHKDLQSHVQVASVKRKLGNRHQSLGALRVVVPIIP